MRWFSNSELRERIASTCRSVSLRLMRPPPTSPGHFLCAPGLADGLAFQRQNADPTLTLPLTRVKTRRSPFTRSVIMTPQPDIDGRIGQGWGGVSPNGAHANVVLARRGTATGAALMTTFTSP